MAPHALDAKRRWRHDDALQPTAVGTHQDAAGLDLIRAGRIEHGSPPRVDEFDTVAVVGWIIRVRYEVMAWRLTPRLMPWPRRPARPHVGDGPLEGFALTAVNEIKAAVS